MLLVALLLYIKNNREISIHYSLSTIVDRKMLRLWFNFKNELSIQNGLIAGLFLITIYQSLSASVFELVILSCFF